MVTTQLTRIKNLQAGTDTRRRHDTGQTLTFSTANVTTLISGIDPLYVLKRIDNNGNAYPFTLQARSRAEFETTDFDTVWNLLIENPDRAFKL